MNLGTLSAANAAIFHWVEYKDGLLPELLETFHLEFLYAITMYLSFFVGSLSFCFSCCQTGKF